MIGSKGTVVNKPTIAQIGEDGAEAVVPLERNTQWIQRVSEEMQNQGGFVGGSEVIELLKVIVELLKLIIKDNGDLPDALLEAMDMLHQVTVPGFLQVAQMAMALCQK